MKVFTLGKLENADLRFNTNVKTQKEISIESSDEFNSVRIVNPKNANAIYIIENMEIKVYDDNKLKIFIGEECSESGNELNIHYKFLDELTDYIEIKDAYTEKTKVNEILNEQIIFMLPNGCLVLRMEKAVRKLEIKISWKEEPIL